MRPSSEMTSQFNRQRKSTHADEHNSSVNFFLKPLYSLELHVFDCFSFFLKVSKIKLHTWIKSITIKQDYFSALLNANMFIEYFSVYFSNKLRNKIEINERPLLRHLSSDWMKSAEHNLWRSHYCTAARAVGKCRSSIFLPFFPPGNNQWNFKLVQSDVDVSRSSIA